MNAEQRLISKFYTHFQQGNWKEMLECYHEEVYYYNPVFKGLEGIKVRAMWELFLHHVQDPQLSFTHVEGADGYGSCDWTAQYRFAPTGKKVIHKARTHFFIIEGKIAEHQDDFNLWNWSAQALGIKGLLFGWTSTLQQGIRASARGSLDKFIAARMSSS